MNGLMHNAPPIERIRGRILGRVEFLFVQAPGENGHRRLVARYDITKLVRRRDVEIYCPAMEAAWKAATRTAARLRKKQKRDEAGNARAARIQEKRRAEAAKNRPPTKPEINLTIKRKWLDAIVYGRKHEEYRSADNPQCRRLWAECTGSSMFPRRDIIAVFRAGYTMDSYSAAVLVRSISQRMGVNGRTYPGDGEFGFSFGPFVPDCTMGEPCPELHFALGIGRVLRVGKYADVKAWLAPLLPDIDLAKEGGRP